MPEKRMNMLQIGRTRADETPRSGHVTKVLRDLKYHRDSAFPDRDSVIRRMVSGRSVDCYRRNDGHEWTWTGKWQRVVAYFNPILHDVVYFVVRGEPPMVLGGCWIVEEKTDK